MAITPFSSESMNPAQSGLSKPVESRRVGNHFEETFIVGDHRVETTKDCVTGVITREDWLKSTGDGFVADRTDGPALILRDPHTGVTTDEEWWRDAKRERKAGPAIIERDPKTGVIFHESWWSDDKLNRPGNLPAVVKRNPITGTVTEEEWWDFGRLIKALNHAIPGAKPANRNDVARPDLLHLPGSI